MAEARKVIVVFLVLLFIIIGIGVMFSRLPKDKNNKPILGGILDNVFFSKSLRTTPTPTPTGRKLITIRNDSTAPGGSIVVNENDNSNSNTGGGTVEKGGTTPTSIPATGTPTLFLLFSGASLGSGLLLKKFGK